jgi:hypothetical protein
LRTPCPRPVAGGPADARRSRRATQLTEQTQAANAAAAAAAAGGALEPMESDWAPWPKHSWPTANSPEAISARANAQTVQMANAASVMDLQSQASAYGC